MRHVTSPRTVSKSTVSGMKKSSSDQNLHDLSTNSTLVTFSHLNTQDMIESRAYPQMSAIHVSQGHSSRSQKSYSLPQDRSRNVRSSLETLEGLLKQANMEMARESLPLLLNTSTTQAGDVTLSTADLNSTQPSPPQKEERDRTAEIENGASDENEEQVSGLYENLHEQLERKKASLGMSRDRGNDGDSLDPERWWVHGHFVLLWKINRLNGHPNILSRIALQLWLSWFQNWIATGPDRSKQWVFELEFSGVF